MMTKMFSLAGAIILCTAMAAPAQTALPSGVSGHSAHGGTVLHKRVRDSAAALLSKQVDSVDWVETTFEEVIDWLYDLGDEQVNVIPRWTALDVDGVGPESLITLKLTNVKVYEVLDEVLVQLSEDDTLGYQAVRNILKISGKQDLNKRLYVRVYDASDILHRVRNFGQEAPSIDLQQTADSSGGGGGQSVFSGGSSSTGSGASRGGKQAEKELERQLKDIMELIRTSIAPSSWAVTEGRRATAAAPGQGTIAVFNRSLVVYATPEVHELIVGYFVFGG